MWPFTGRTYRTQRGAIPVALTYYSERVQSKPGKGKRHVEEGRVWGQQTKASRSPGASHRKCLTPSAKHCEDTRDVCQPGKLFRLRDQGFCWGLGMQAPPSWPASPTEERVSSVKHVVSKQFRPSEPLLSARVVGARPQPQCLCQLRACQRVFQTTVVSGWLCPCHPHHLLPPQ